MRTFNEWLLERDEEFIRKLMTMKPARNLSPRERMASSFQGMIGHQGEETGGPLDPRLYRQPREVPGDELEEPGREEALAKQIDKFADFRAQQEEDKIARKKLRRMKRKAQLRRMEKKTQRNLAKGMVKVGNRWHKPMPGWQ